LNLRKVCRALTAAVDADKSGYWANEVRDITKETLIVRTKIGVCAKGPYAEVIEKKECRGAKYCQSVYIGYQHEGKLVIANIQMVGACVSAWIEFRKKNKIMDGAIEVKDFTHGEKGSNKFVIPNFRKIPVKPETEEAAKALDVELQEYLKAYFKIQRDRIAQEQTVEAVASDLPVMPASSRSEQPVVPIPMAKEAKAAAPVADAPIAEAYDDLPF